jgi:two-component system response regulator AtoC
MLNNTQPAAPFRTADAHASQSEDDPSAFPPFVCLSSVLRRLVLQAEITTPRLQFATLEGSAGTGKHLFAQNMHRHSALAGLPFVRQDARQWLASDADTATLAGTLYLDRVDLLPPLGQGLLLNLVKTLQNDAAKPSPFLLLLSTHASLRQLAGQGIFLPDLAFRLAAVRFCIPPLRERREDIAPIAQALIDRICRRYRQPTAALAPGTLPHLLQYPWPGNVRELASVLESAILDSRTGMIRPADVTLHLQREAAALQLSGSSGHAQALQTPSDATRQPEPSQLPGASAPLNPAFSATTGPTSHPDLSLDTAILRHIQFVLEMHRGNKLRAARELGISRSTLYRLLAGDPISPVANYSRIDK